MIAISLEKMYQSQLNLFDTQILGYSGTIAEIDAQGLTGTDLAACLDNDRAQLVNMVNRYQGLRTNIQTKLARVQGGWTGQYSTYVAEIESGYTGVYTYQLNTWLADDLSSKYTPFFSMYADATNDFQKQRLLKMTFGH